MKRVLDELDKYLDMVEQRRDNDDFHLRGSQGFCFITGKNIIKIYDCVNINKCDLSSFTSNRISFPYYYIERDGNIYGEVMPYYNVLDLWDSLNKDCLVNLLINHYKAMTKEINNFPDILMNDLSYPNVLYDEKKGFYLIDTTRWDLNSKKDSNVRINIDNFNRSIIILMLNILFEYEVRKELRDIEDYYFSIKDSAVGKELLNILKVIFQNSGDYPFLELMEAYKEIIKKVYNYDVKTLEDIKIYTKIMKYR